MHKLFSRTGRVQRARSLKLGGNTDTVFALSSKLRVFLLHRPGYIMKWEVYI